MRIETYPNGKYQILRVVDSNEISELNELQDLVSGYLKRDKKFIAVSFSDATYIYSGAIRVLIECHKMVTNDGGTLCIIEPNLKLFDILEVLNIDRVIDVYVSEEFLPK